MNINITSIVDAKIESLKESGTIEKQIEKQVSSCISDVASKIGLSAYNGFIAEKIKQITEGIMREDIAKKIQTAFDEILVAKHDGIKLSELFNKYREWLFDVTEEEEKWNRHTFTCKFEENTDGNFTHIYAVFGEEDNQNKFDADITISFCTYRNETQVSIASLHFEGTKVSDALRIGCLSEFQCLLVNLYYNKTKIILDVDNVNDDCHYDIDD